MQVDNYEQDMVQLEAENEALIKKIASLEADLHQRQSAANLKEVDDAYHKVIDLEDSLRDARNQVASYSVFSF
jgi:uncharacterized coiled-coil DUF342 family protein